MNGVVVEAEHFTDITEEFWLLTSHPVRHIRFPSKRFAVAYNWHGAKLSKDSTAIILSRQNGKLIDGQAS
jgi:hypothetical protein